MVGELELAYLAGFLDGEGYIGILRHTHKASKRGYTYEPIVKVVNTDRRPIDRYRSRFGGYLSLRHFPGKNNKDAHGWDLKNVKPVLAFLTTIRPYLWLKADQADAVIELCSSGYGMWGRKSVPDDECARREALYDRIRVLNHRGLPPAETEREDTQTATG